MDFGAMPPEINSARMYSGPGSAPMLAAAAAWDGLADELRSAASTYQSVIFELANEGWLGPASASMAAAVAPYVTWMSVTGVQAEQTAANSAAAAGAFESAFAMTVPPAEVAANRAQLLSLIATNFLGINTPAIAATEALYGEMWAQDAAAMYGYAASSAVAAVLKPFTQPAQVTNPAGQAGQAAAVAQATGAAAGTGQTTLAQLTSAVPAALQSLSSPLASLQAGPLWDFLDSNFVNGWVSAGYVNPGIIEPAVTAAMADINAVSVAAQPEATALPPMGSGSGNGGWLPIGSAGLGLGGLPGSPGGLPFGTAGVPGADLTGVSAGMSRGAFVGRLSVPQSWTQAVQVANHAGAALPGGGWTGTALPESSAGMPGVPGMPMPGAARYGFGHGPRYGFQPTVMPRPPAAG
jgi:PPE-repeat protein